ncbi:YacL family protein [Pseudoalteromonas sp. MMG013]|uniref:UPF0231 family protein n=1 Tax=unclassified Pseudoalteromonas TaxID=194690 RepID=UPI001B3792A2|nr:MULTISPECIES: YacL family protein [unclassified Pseudoalteromonas]MBQ4847111.1 YacL family protein [Pseudoalteromonas sp. MMG005]MBQ4861383.1 YacL family protein [Pseudoalteromonas sp. MMG013]
MEYQFIRDPIAGLKVRISDEQALIARWLNEELDKSEVAELVTRCHMMTKGQPAWVRLGNEIRFTLNADEALFEAHALFQEGDDISQYADDALELDDHGLVAGCGFEDFVALLMAWQAFIAGK